MLDRVKQSTCTPVTNAGTNLHGFTSQTCHEENTPPEVSASSLTPSKGTVKSPQHTTESSAKQLLHTKIIQPLQRSISFIFIYHGSQNNSKKKKKQLVENHPKKHTTKSFAPATFLSSGNHQQPARLNSSWSHGRVRSSSPRRNAEGGVGGFPLGWVVRHGVSPVEKMYLVEECKLFGGGSSQSDQIFLRLRKLINRILTWLESRKSLISIVGLKVA